MERCKRNESKSKKKRNKFYKFCVGREEILQLKIRYSSFMFLLSQ